MADKSVERRVFEINKCLIEFPMWLVLSNGTEVEIPRRASGLELAEGSRRGGNDPVLGQYHAIAIVCKFNGQTWDGLQIAQLPGSDAMTLIQIVVLGKMPADLRESMKIA